MAKTVAQNTPTRGNKTQHYPVAAGVVIPAETHVFLNASGYATPTPAAGYSYAGLSRGDRGNIDNTDGDAGDLFVECDIDCQCQCYGTGFTQADVGKLAYLSDNYTVTLTAAGNVRLGRIAEVVSSTTVWVMPFEELPAMPIQTYTQTYSTADRTIAAPTAATLTVTDGAGTPDGTIGAITGDASVIAAVQELAAQINKLIADDLDVRQGLSALVDDLQAVGVIR